MADYSWGSGQCIRTRSIYGEQPKLEEMRFTSGKNHV